MERSVQKAEGRRQEAEGFYEPTLTQRGMENLDAVVLALSVSKYIFFFSGLDTHNSSFFGIPYSEWSVRADKRFKLYG